MDTSYDVFLSHAWADGDYPQKIGDALRGAGLSIWFDATEIHDFESITNAVNVDLARSKALLAYYSKTYPLRRACQWELTAAFLAGQCAGDPRKRVLIVNPETKADHIHPIELRDARFFAAPKNDEAALQALANIVLQHVRDLKGTLSEIHPFASTEWYGTTPLGSTCFVGRIPEMWKLHSILHAGDVTQISGATLAGAYPVIVTGTAGSISHYSEAQLVVQGDITGSIPSNSAPVSVGNSATFNLTLSSVGGLSDQFTLSCVNPPLGLTCAFNPTSAMLPANGTVGTTLTVTVNSKPSSAISPSHPVQWPIHGRQIVAQAPLVLALLLLLLRHARPFRDSQVAVRVLMFAFGILVLTQVIACGGGGTSGGGGSQPPPPTPAQVTLSIQAASPTVTKTVATVKITVP